MARRGGKASGDKPDTFFEKLDKRRKSGKLSLTLADAELNGLPPKPSWLNDTAQECWDDVVAELQKVDQLKQLDVRALCYMCEMWSLYRESVQELEQDFENAALAALTLKYGKAFVDAARDFGMTPKSRSNIHNRPDKATDNPLEEFGIVAG